MASAHSRQATPTTVFVLGCFVAFLNFFLYYTSRLDLPKNWHFKNRMYYTFAFGLSKFSISEILLKMSRRHLACDNKKNSKHKKSLAIINIQLV